MRLNLDTHRKNFPQTFVVLISGETPTPVTAFTSSLLWLMPEGCKDDLSFEVR